MWDRFSYRWGRVVVSEGVHLLDQPALTSIFFLPFAGRRMRSQKEPSRQPEIVPRPLQLLDEPPAKPISLCAQAGLRSFASAIASIWRMRSRPRYSASSRL